MSKPASNAPAVAARLRSAQAAVRAELQAELGVQAEKVAGVMKLEAPKFRSTLTNSVRASRVSAFEWLVRPYTDYDKWVQLGRKPGKGLPRFDPGSAAVAWLQSKLNLARLAVNPRYRPGRRGSARRSAEDQELRDRYWAWSRAVKQRGIKPNDYVGRTRDRTTADVQAALAVAVQRGLRAHLKGGAA